MTENTIDSNATGLRYAEEETPGVLPATPVWQPLEPNSYRDFGVDTKLVARNPINDSRSRKKGVVTDEDAGGGFSADLTQINLRDLLQGYFLADMRVKGLDNGPLVGGVAGVTFTPTQYTAGDGSPDLEFTVSTHGLLTGDGPFYFVEGSGTLPGNVAEDTQYWIIKVDDDTFSVATSLANAVAGTAVAYSSAGTDDATRLFHRRESIDGTNEYVYVNDSSDYYVGALLYDTGYTTSANNGIKTVTAVAAGRLTVSEDLTTEAVAPAAAQALVVGVEYGTAELDVVVSGDLPVLTRASGTVDATAFGIVPGEWVYVGGDGAGEDFSNAVNNGFKRVRSVAAAGITLDKADAAMTAETGTGLTVRLFFGRVLKNEAASLITKRSYQLERTLGAPDSASPALIQSEYIIRAAPSEVTLNIPSADKVTMDLSFVAADGETRTAATGVKSGTRPTLVEADAFNTSSDFKRIRLGLVSATDVAPTPLFAFAQELKFTINNNVTPNKAVGTLGAIEMSYGTFEVGGSITAYFADVTAVAAVKANSDITIDAIIVKDNAGIALDLPLIALGGGKPDVQQDRAITIPLDMQAAQASGVASGYDHTALMVFFDYLPDAAE